MLREFLKLNLLYMLFFLSILGKVCVVCFVQCVCYATSPVEWGKDVLMQAAAMKLHR